MRNVLLYSLVLCLGSITKQQLVRTPPFSDASSSRLSATSEFTNDHVGDAADEEALGQLIKSLAMLKPYSELHLLLDSSRASGNQASAAAKMLASSGILSSSWETEHLTRFQNSLPAEPCPVYDVVKGAIQRSTKADVLLPARYHRRMLFAWTTSLEALEEAYSLFNNTVEVCPQQIDPGLFADQTSFFFYVGRSKELLESVFDPEHSRLRSHPRVAVIRLMESEQEAVQFGIYRFNFFDSSNTTGPILSHIYSSNGRPIRSERDVFTRLNNFEGSRVRVTAVPFSVFVNGDEVDKDPTHVWTNHWGFEISILRAISKILNFTTSIYNPVDQDWSPTHPDGSFGGMIGELAQGNADVAMGDFGFAYTRAQVAQISVPLTSDYLCLATPAQRPMARTYAIFLPFTPFVWLCIAIALPLTAVTLHIIATAEGALQGKRFPPWDDPKEVMWLFLAIWCICCLLLTASYGGMLRSFLTMPVLEPAIDSLESAVASKLPVHMPIYGTDEEKIMASSANPTIKHIWDSKIVDNRDSGVVMEDVYRGGALFLGWFTDFSTLQQQKFSTSDGTALIHISTQPLITGVSYVGWYFTPFLPWKQAIDTQLSRIVASGLITPWRNKALAHDLESRPSPKSTGGAVPLNVGDMASPFILLGSILTIGLVAMIAELFANAIRRSKPRRIGEYESPKRHNFRYT